MFISTLPITEVPDTGEGPMLGSGPRDSRTQGEGPPVSTPPSGAKTSLVTVKSLYQLVSVHA